MIPLLSDIHATVCAHIALATAVSVGLATIFALAAIWMHLDIRNTWKRREKRYADHPFGIDVRDLMRVTSAEGV